MSGIIPFFYHWNFYDWAVLFGEIMFCSLKKKKKTLWTRFLLQDGNKKRKLETIEENEVCILCLDDVGM